MLKTIQFTLFLALLSVSGYTQTVAGYTGLGSKAINRGDYMQALDYLNKAITISPYNAEAYFLRAYAKWELDDHVGAEKDFSEAIRLNPKNHEAFLYRGVVRSQQLKYKQAFEDFNEALRLNDEDWQVYANRALASLYLDRFVDVISDCNRVIDLKKDNSQTYLLRGEAKAGLEMYNVAIEDFEKAIKKDSTAMQPVLRRGIARTKLKQFDLAIADYEQSMKMDTNSALPIFYRGVAYAEMGKQQQALDDFNTVLDNYPQNEVVLFNRAMLYGDMNKEQEALADYNLVVRLNPTNILARFNRGILYLNKGKYKEALADFNKTLELFPEFLDAHETRLQTLRMLKDKDAYEKAEMELAVVREQLIFSDDEVKEDQHVKLMKLTELKGDFEKFPQEVGKVQYEKVDIRLLPFYRISPFPETDTDISVYDGYGRPFYNMGIITFTDKAPELTVEQTKRALFELLEKKEITPTELVRAIPLYARMHEFQLAYSELDKRIAQDEKQAAYYFARACLGQIQLELSQRAQQKKMGSLDIVDTVYQNKMEQLISAIEQDYRKVINLDSSMSFAYFNLGHILATAERYEEAEIQFGLAAEVRGNFIEANYNRGLIRLVLGKTEKACEDLSLAGELGFTDAYNVINRYCD
ncbi:MAG: tetratricopeptide repeat protein [Flavobacteriales bacterium]|nr:tetratricopeptide repeat protein [Flavobacteriales bacterium]